MKIVAVIPAFNEKPTLAAVVEKTLTQVDQVVVVDDGSSRALGQYLPHDNRIISLRHPINLGKGAAMKTGVEASLRLGADVVVFLDSDGQHNPDEIPGVVAPILAGQNDIVFGVRSFDETMPFVSKIGNRFLTRMASVLFRIYVRDTQSGFRAFRTAVYPKLYWGSARYAVETEMIVNAGKHHLRWTEAPISTIYHDAYRGTTVLDGIRIFFSMIAWRFI